MKRILLGILLGCSLTANCQEAKKELFKAENGSVLIRSYSPIGAIFCRSRATVAVEVRHLWNAVTDATTYGITIQVQHVASAHNNTSFVDYAEMGSMIKGIEYIRKVDKPVTKLEKFESEYATIAGDLTLTTLLESTGDLTCVIVSGTIGAAKAYLTMDQLEQLRLLIEEGKKRIESLR